MIFFLAPQISPAPIGPFQSSIVRELTSSLALAQKSQGSHSQNDLDLTPTVVASAPAKRPKVKAVVDPSVDVEQLAREGQMNKVNVPTLVDWLKKRGIPCKAKEKKDDLVAKVRGHLGIYESEP